MVAETRDASTIGKWKIEDMINNNNTNNNNNNNNSNSIQQ